MKLKTQYIVFWLFKFKTEKVFKNIFIFITKIIVNYNLKMNENLCEINYFWPYECEENIIKYNTLC